MKITIICSVQDVLQTEKLTFFTLNREWVVSLILCFLDWIYFAKQIHIIYPMCVVITNIKNTVIKRWKIFHQHSNMENMNFLILNNFSRSFLSPL